MTNDIVKIKSVAASQGGETEHGLMLDSSILSYTYQGSSKTVKWILDTIFTLLGGKAASATTLAGYGITDAYTKTQVDSALAGKANSSHTHAQSDVTGLSAALAGKANSSHTHTIQQITGLSSALDGKADIHDGKIENSEGESEFGIYSYNGDASFHTKEEDSSANINGNVVNIVSGSSIKLRILGQGEAYQEAELKWSNINKLINLLNS